MKRMQIVALSMATMAVVAVCSARAGDTTSTTKSITSPPLVLPVKEVKFEIVNAAFVDKLVGLNANFNSQKPDKSRGLILTVRIKKPAGRELTFLAQDFTLHYRYGENSKAIRCVGLSSFSTCKDVARPMLLFADGEGVSKIGPPESKEETLFVDLFFLSIENNPSQLHLFVAQPVDASIETTGWK